MGTGQVQQGKAATTALAIIVIVLIAGLGSLWVYVGGFKQGAGGGGNDSPDDLRTPVSGVLPEVEATEFMGEELVPIELQGNNAIKGTQYVDRDGYRLRVTGLVENELSMTYDELLELPAVSEAVYLQCVEGWGFMAKWTGFRVIDLLDLAVLDESAAYVVFHCAEDYSTGHELEYLRDEEIIMAYGLNDVTLPQDRGFPFQLVAKGKYGYKWAKWITEIEVVDEDVLGYWERRGYSDTAKVGESGWTGRVYE